MFKKLEAGWLDTELEDEFGEKITFSASYIGNPLYDFAKFLLILVKNDLLDKYTEDYNLPTIFFDGETEITYIIYLRGIFSVVNISNKGTTVIDLHIDPTDLTTKFLLDINDNFLDNYSLQFFDEDERDECLSDLNCAIGELQNLYEKLVITENVDLECFELNKED